MSVAFKRSLGGLFWTYLRPLWKKFTLLTALLLTSIGLQLLDPQILRIYIDTVQAGGSQEILIHLAWLFLGIALANQLIAAGAAYIGQDVGWTATNRLREDLARHCLAQDMAFHNVHTPGEFIERIDGDLTALSNFFSAFVIQIVGSALLLTGTLIVLFIANWHIGLALTILAAVALSLLVLLRNIALSAGIRERAANAHFFGFLEERLAGVDDIRANGGSAHVMHGFFTAIHAWFHRGRRAWFLRSSSFAVMLLLFAAGYVIVFTMGSSLFLAGTITLGTVYLVFQYNEMLQMPLERITQQMQDFQKAITSVARVRELAQFQPTMTDGNRATLPTGPLAVTFDEVTFAYHAEDEPVLHAIDFTLPPGQVLGLLGRTGSGKSTISRLLFRLYDPTQGIVRLNGIDLRDVPLADLRQHVGMVTQDVQLFHASVRDNLTFFDASIPDERILRIIAEMGLDTWYAALPHGLDTALESGGAGLSAGEAQLLAFVRVFLKDPGLVILDEPSSRLDPATEQMIERGVRLLLHGRTGIIIAHRLATVQRADAIMVIEDGQILEYGPRAPLARDPRSRFHALLQIGVEEALV